MPKHSRLDDQITSIALLAFSHEGLVTAKKGVRDAVRYAEKKGNLTIQRKQVETGKRPAPSVDEDEFRYWAAEQWPELRQHLKVPITGELVAEMGRISCSMTAVVIPVDRDELIRQFVEVSDSLIQANEKLDKCTKRLAQLEEGAVKRQEEDDLTKQRHIESGKKGGRGNRSY